MPDWKDRVLSATCAVRAGNGERPIGTGVLIEPDKVLTCRHVITQDGRPDGAERPGLVVTFPDGEAVGASPEQGYAGCDAVVLTLDGRRSPDGTAILSGSYRAPANVDLVGYPAADRTDDAVWRSFAVRGPTASGLVQLDWQDVGSFRGHSGGPVVDPGTGALVGLLREGSEAGRFDRYLPLRRMLETGVLGRLPWLMEGDDAEGHFTRRSRGRSAVAGKDLFTGREHALDTAVAWLDRPEPTGRVLVVTGRPGAGKSAVIARAGTTVMSGRRGDPNWRGLLFHARNADDVHFRRAVADLFGASDHASEPGLLVSADTIAESRPDTRWVLVVDGLDEAATSQDRRAIASLLANLARRPWVRAAVATRPLSPSGPFGADSLLRRFGVTGPGDTHLLDLDTGAYFALDDLTAFTERLLCQDDQQFRHAEGRAWPRYRADEALRRRLARAIAVRADRNFLVASLTAHSLSENPDVLDPDAPGFDRDSLPSTVSGALGSFLDGRWEDPGTRGVLTALAYAEGSGVDDATWLLFSAALGYPVAQVVLDELRRSPIADYLLHSRSEVDGHATRLFHQALVDQLVGGRDRRRDQELIFQSLVARAGDGGGWQRAGTYVHARLAAHAAAAGRLGELLTDPEFLLVAHLRRLRRLAEGVDLDRDGTQYRAVLERAGAEAESMPPVRRAFALSLTAAHLGLPGVARRFDLPEATASVRWAHDLGNAHETWRTEDRWIPAMTTLPGPGGTLLVTGGEDGTIRFWSPVTGRQDGDPLTGHTDPVAALVVLAQVDGTSYLASGSWDGTIRIWDPVTRRPVGGPLTGHTNWVTALAVVSQRDGSTCLASAGWDGTIRNWDPATGTQLGKPIAAAFDMVNALAVVRGPEGSTRFVTAGETGSIRVWADDGSPVGERLGGYTGAVHALAAVPTPDGGTWLASAGEDGAIRFWDPTTGEGIGDAVTGHTGAVRALALVPRPDGGTWLASAGEDETVRIWDPTTRRPVGEPLTGHTAPVLALAALPGGPGEARLASAGYDQAIRIWSPDAGPRIGGPLRGNSTWVNALAAVPASDGGTTVIVSADNGGVIRRWDALTGHEVGRAMTGHTGAVWALAVVPGAHGAPRIVSGGTDATVRIWDLAGGEQLGEPRTGHRNWVRALAVVPGPPGGAVRIVSADLDGTILVREADDDRPSGRVVARDVGAVDALAAFATSDGSWRVASAGAERGLVVWDLDGDGPAGTAVTGHSGSANVLAVLPGSTDGETPRLVSTGEDGRIRIWDPVTATALGESLTGHDARGRALTVVTGGGGIAPETGTGTGGFMIRIVSGGTDDTVRIWDPATGRQLGPPLDFLEPPGPFAVLDRGLAVATGRAIVVLDLRLDELT